MTVLPDAPTRLDERRRICRVEREHVVVARDDDPRADVAAECRCLDGVEIARDTTFRRTTVDWQQRDVDLLRCEHVGHAVVPNGVAAVIQRPLAAPHDIADVSRFQRFMRGWNRFDAEGAELNALADRESYGPRPIDVQAIGHGTQRIEMSLRAAFPDARVLRIDRDTTRAMNVWPAMRNAIERRQVDILVGTQLLSKGHDFPGVGLVCVLDADRSLYSTDFRASEQLFAQLVQVAGRAGRGATPGEVLSALNHYIHLTLSRQGLYATAFCFRFEPDTNRVLYAGAAHPPEIGSR